MTGPPRLPAQRAPHRVLDAPYPAPAWHRPPRRPRGRGRVYTTTGGRRRRRRETTARWFAPAAGVAALAFMCTGLVTFSLPAAAGGAGLAAASAAAAVWGLRDARPW